MSADPLNRLPPRLLEDLRRSADPDARLEEEVQRQLLRTRASREARRRDEADAFDPLDVVTLAEELARPAIEHPWTIDRLHGLGHNTTVAAAFKTGKSTLMATLVKSLADQVPFLGEHEVRQLAGTIAYVNLELTDTDFRDYFESVGIARTDRVVLFPARGRRLDLFSEAWFEWLVGELKRCEAEAMILDPFSGVFHGDENSNSEVGTFVKRLDELKVRSGVVDLFMPVHMGRGGEERARGASKLDDWADARWLYVRDEAGRRYLRGTVRGVGDLDKRQTVVGPDGRVTYGGPVGGTGRARTVTIRQALIDFVEGNPGCTLRQIEQGVSGNSGEVRSGLKALVASNDVVVLVKGRAHHHFPVGFDTSGFAS